MKPTKDQWILCISFCAFLGIMAVLFLLLPKADFSQTEKRYLEDSPRLTVDTLASGEFGEDMESYMADHIPGRDFFVGLNSYFELFTGRQIAKDIYVAQGNRLVEAPVVWNEVQASKNMNAVSTFADTIGTQVDFMLVPSGGWAVEDTVTGIADPYEDETIIRQLYAMAGENVACSDVLTVFAQAEDKAALYYKTDHHWTSLGAYTAYRHFAESKGMSYPATEDFAVRTVEDFKGSNHSRAALWMIPGEPLEMWSHSENITVTNADKEGDHAGIFYEERLQEGDKYTVFLDGNHSVVRIKNPDNAGKGSILVIRDSYSNCLGGFLAESYENVVLVDLRYYKEPISELYAGETFKDVLVCYSIGNFMTDTNLVWLR